MSITTLISNINRQNTYPVTQTGSAPSNCGLLCLTLSNTLTEQMLKELPTIEVNVFMPNGTKLTTISIDMYTVNKFTGESTEPYAIPLYNLPEDFIFSVEPLFDKYATSSHNAQIETGDFTLFNTSDTGIVDTNTESYTSLLWTTYISNFVVTISFDDSNIVAGGGSGGGGGIAIDTEVNGTSTNPVENKAIYDFVNSSVSTNTAYFIGTYSSLAELEAHTDYPYHVTNNDYGFVISIDSSGNTVYNRYKYNSESSEWQFEYPLNNSSFTAIQWETINSGITASDKTNWNNKQDSLTEGQGIDIINNVVGVKIGSGLTTDQNGNIKTTIVGEILSETAYEALVTKDKDIYFTYD